MSYSNFDVVTYMNPIQIISNVASLKILSSPLIIQEGEPFGENNLKIQVFDNQSQPIPNKLVICLIASINDQYFNYRYGFSKRGYYNKDIIKPFPGKYDPNVLNPLTSDDFQPIFTDSNGTVSFQETYFSIYGIIGIFEKIILTIFIILKGNYSLEFVCDGISIFSKLITVFLKKTFLLYISRIFRLPALFIEYSLQLNLRTIFRQTL